MPKKTHTHTHTCTQVTGCLWIRTLHSMIFTPISSMPFPWTLSNTLKCVRVCPCPSGTAMTEVAGSGKWANQRCAAPYFLSRMASIPRQFNQGCQRNCTNPFSWYFNSSLFTQAFGHLHQVKFNTVDDLFNASEMETQFHKWEKWSNYRSVVTYCQSVCGQAAFSKAPKRRRICCINVR